MQILIFLFLISSFASKLQVVLYPIHTYNRCLETLTSITKKNPRLIKGNSRLVAHHDLFIFAETQRAFLAFADIPPKETPPFKARVLIISKETAKKLGILYIEVFPDGQTAHIPIVLNRSARGMGLGTEAKYAALKYVFNLWNVNSVIATIYDDNTDSINLHKKLGFKQKEQHFKISQYELDKNTFKEIEKDFDNP